MKKIYETTIDKEKLKKLPSDATIGDKVACYEPMVGYEDLKPKERFIYISRLPVGEWQAVKIDEKHAALINNSGKYILAEKYANCLSVGSEDITEYQELDDLLAAIK